MKAKVSRGGGFRGALNYVFDTGKKATGDKKPEIVGGTLGGESPREIASELAVVRQLRPDIGRPVWHCSLALPAGERLEPGQWDEIAADFMSEMQFPEDTPWVAVRHGDTDHDHIHIIASRVSLAGKVWHGKWEARTAITATETLEQRHGLSLTPGLGDARAERRGLSAAEINMAVRTESEPPRQRLQRLIDEALKQNPTSFEFAESLEAAGVSVRANIASTGKMNGFSFEIDGIKFKGSDLGKRYTWSGLQENGVSYEQARDGEKLARFAHRNSNRNVEVDTGSSDGNEVTSGGSGERVERATGTLGADHESAAPDAGRGDARDNGKSVSNTERGNASKTESSRTVSRESGKTVRAPGDMAADGLDGRGRVAGRGADTGWNSRFKRASAAKRRASGGPADAEGRGNAASALEQSDSRRTRIAAEDRESARLTDPTEYLKSNGFTVKKDGQRHLSVRSGKDEVYRITQKNDGRYLWCDLYGNAGGDNIDLVKEIEGEGIGFAEAVYRLTGGPLSPSPSRPTTRAPRPRVPPRLPVQSSQDERAGREYLRNRGISDEVMKRAEACGMLAYCHGGVLFVGRDDQGAAQNVTKRATHPAADVQKRDLRGSDKAYPPVLTGSPDDVWVVEGGADALALHDLYRRADREPPTVLVSSGANVLSWLDNPSIQEILKGAKKVTLATENEKDEDARQRAEAGHQGQREGINSVTGQEPREWRPSANYKDLADYNERKGDVMERREKAQREAARHAPRQRDNGPTMGR